MSKPDNPARHLDFYQKADEEFRGEKIQVSDTKQIRISAFQTDKGVNMMDIRIWTMYEKLPGLYFPRKQGFCVPVRSILQLSDVLNKFINSHDVMEI